MWRAQVEHTVQYWEWYVSLSFKYNFNGAIMRISDSESDNICVPALPESRSTVSISSQVAGQQPTSEQDRQQQQQQQQQTKS